MRASVDRPVGDAAGGSSVRPVRHAQKAELPALRDVVEASFGGAMERPLGARPRLALGGAQYVHHRWLMEPLGCFVAEHEGRLVGTAIGVTWGTVGVLGPVAVLSAHQDQHVGRRLVEAVQAFFEERRTTLQGLVTSPSSPKHLAFFHRFGYRPRGLVAITSRPVAPEPLAAGPARSGLAMRRFSALDEAHRRAVLGRLRRISGAVHRGLDLTKEIEIAEGLALGDTIVLERGREVQGFAVCHVPGVSEAPEGALYVKFLALAPEVRRPEALEHFLAVLDGLAQELRLTRTIVPVYTRYWTAYTTVLRAGYRIDLTLLRMQRGKLDDPEDPAHLVLDDWR